MFVNNVDIFMKGVFFVCDGGYHKWIQMMNPFKHALDRETIFGLNGWKVFAKM